MKKHIIIALMAIGMGYMPSFAQEQVQSKQQDKEQKKLTTS